MCLRLGIETSTENKWVQWVFGSDLLIGLKYKYTNSYTYSYDIETGQLINDIPTPFLESMVEIKKDDYLLMGLTLSVGLNLKVSNRISTGILLLTDGYYGALINSNSLIKSGDIIDYNQSILFMFNVRI